jgi:photosystem II stability/assembly factor-like uncharacterized protein
MTRLKTTLTAIAIALAGMAHQPLAAKPSRSAGAAPGDATVHWRTLATEAYPKKRDDIIFLDKAHGFYGTGRGDLFETKDGGQTWLRAWHVDGLFIRSINFVDDRVGFIGNLGAGLASTTERTPLFKTEDGGRTWASAGLTDRDIMGVCAIDILHAKAIVEGRLVDRTIVTAAGRANGPAKLARSVDGGRSWRIIDLSDRAGMILDVKFLDPNNGLVFAGTDSDPTKSYALILKTSDGGESWRVAYRSNRLGELIWKASFPNSRVGYASVQSANPDRQEQFVLKTIDGGRHWRELPLTRNARATEFGIGFASPTLGWVGTAIGGFETRDGGRSWKANELAPSTNKIRTRTVSGEAMIYAIGSQVQTVD